MTATPTPPAGTQSFNQIEMLWDRYRSLILTIVLVTVGAIVVNYGLKYFNQKAVDTRWSGFGASISAQDSYSDVSDFQKQLTSLTSSVANVELSDLEKAITGCSPEQRPFLLLAIARRAIVGKQWDRAEQALRDLETGFPNHSLVKKSDYPIQIREDIKPPKDEAKGDAQPKQKVKLEDAVAGSVVARMREQIAAAQTYAVPAQFAQVAPPADATKIRLEFSDGYGHCVIALMPEARLHREAILALAGGETPFWKGIAIDEIRRPSKSTKRPRELHFGYETSKEDDRSKWLTTEPSKNIVEFEKGSLSHFAGAVSARQEADGKSCADRLWISVDDAPANDGNRVVVGYVIEGLENLGRICEASMTAQEEERGEGRPSENIRITGVAVVN